MAIASRLSAARRAVAVASLAGALVCSGVGAGVAGAASWSFGSLGGSPAPELEVVPAATLSDVIVSVGDLGGEVAQLRYDSPQALPAGAQVQVTVLPAGAGDAAAVELDAQVDVDATGTHVVVDGPIAQHTTVQLHFDAPVSGTGTDAVGATVSGPGGHTTVAYLQFGERVGVDGTVRIGD